MIEWTNYLNRIYGDIRYTPYYKLTSRVDWMEWNNKLLDEVDKALTKKGNNLEELLSHISYQYNMSEGDDEAEDFTVPSEQELLEFMNNAEDEA